MIDAVTVAPVLGGLVLLVAGATLSRYGVAAIGALVGAGLGYLGTPIVEEALGQSGDVAAASGVMVGVIVGVFVTYLLLSFAVASISFLVGTFAGLTALAPYLVDGPTVLEWGVALGIGVAAAWAGMLMTTTTMVALSSFLGAALASRSLTVADFEAAQAETSLEPLLFDVTDPIFLIFAIAGILVQFELLKVTWLTTFISRLPGARMVTRNSRGEAGS